jgi:hypothetical protein
MRNTKQPRAAKCQRARVEPCNLPILGSLSPVPAEEVGRPLVDKYGRRYSTAILRHWSKAMIDALGIRPSNDP